MTGVIERGGTGHVAVVTDSAASLPAPMAAALGVVVVPMTLVIDGEALPDGSLDRSEVLRRSRSRSVGTSAPSPGDFLRAVGTLGGRPVVIATITERMSASFESASAAARYLPPGTVEVVDTGTAAGAQALVVLAAARAAAGGASVGQTARAARLVASRVHLMAALESLDHLARSGRVPGIAAWAGRSLRARPLFTLDHGEVRSTVPTLGWSAALERMAAACRREGSPGRRLHAAVLDAHSFELARQLAAMLSEVPDAEVFVAPFSPVMVAHTGPGLVGLGWWWEEEEGGGGGAGTAGAGGRDVRPFGAGAKPSTM